MPCANLHPLAVTQPKTSERAIVLAMPVAVLDACVLIPAGLRDVLLSVADVGCFRPIWQEQIEDEIRRNTIRLRAKVGALASDAAAQVEIVLASINRAFPDGRLSRSLWKELVDECTNDPKDRHVLAAAVGAEATHLVTSNLRDFPQSSRPSTLNVLEPDEFLLDCLANDPDRTVQAVRNMAARHRRPPHTPLEVAVLMRGGTLIPRFGAAIEDRLATDGSA